MTAAAIELTWPGVPVTACASILPSRSNTPAERSPASRTVVEKAVRTRVCACSSTTAISRLHMICMWIWDNAVLGMEGIGSDLAGAPPTTGEGDAILCLAGRPAQRVSKVGAVWVTAT